MQKGRYQCNQSQAIDGDHQLYLNIDIFAFVLRKVDKSELDKIKEEMEALKAEREVLDKEIKMFNFMLLGAGLPPNTVTNFAKSTHLGSKVSLQHLFVTVRAFGVAEDQQKDSNRISAADQNEISGFSEDFSKNNDVSAQKNYFIEVEEQLPSDVMNLCGNSKTFEALMVGPGIKGHMVVRIQKVYAKKFVQVDNTRYQYGINVSVRQGAEYLIYVARV